MKIKRLVQNKQQYNQLFEEIIAAKDINYDI